MFTHDIYMLPSPTLTTSYYIIYFALSQKRLPKVILWKQLSVIRAEGRVTGGPWT